jgi:hypothetical protein
MSILTLPPWVKEGQEILIAGSTKTYTIQAIRLGSSLVSSYVRIEHRDDVSFNSLWVSLRDLFEHYRPKRDKPSRADRPEEQPVFVLEVSLLEGS